MTYTLLFLPIVLPVLFWAGYHYYKDRHLPEPPGQLALAFLLGVASSYLALYRVGAATDSLSRVRLSTRRTHLA